LPARRGPAAPALTRHNHTNVDYREFAPPPALRDHVACVWTRTGAPARVLPDGCVDIVWTGTRLIVAGPATRATVPGLPPEALKFGVRFRVGSAGAALGVPASEVLDCSPELSDVWPAGGELAERIGAAPAGDVRLHILIDAIAGRLIRAPAPDPLVRAAVLELARPRTTIRGLAPRLGISERQLRRRFEQTVGYSPKTLARVLRMQRFLGVADRNRDLARAALDAGYADQSHLTRECTALSGLPAATLLRTGAGPAGESLIAA
jgi:AraC-like DNA-binding protein